MEISSNVKNLQQYKVATRVDEDGSEWIVIVKAEDNDEATGEIFTIETLEREFVSLRQLDPFGNEPVFEIAEGIECRARGIVDEPRAEKLLRELDRVMSKWSCLFTDECFDETGWAKEYQERADRDRSAKDAAQLID
jgi:hypothetical protein